MVTSNVALSINALSEGRMKLDPLSITNKNPKLTSVFDRDFIFNLYLARVVAREMCVVDNVADRNSSSGTLNR